MEKDKLLKLEQSFRDRERKWYSWISLVLSFKKDAIEHLRQIYQTVEPGTILDDDLTITSKSAILHSSKHSYIYEYAGFGHYGNDCKPWPFEDESLWPWTRSRVPTPHLNRDVWNIVFSKLCPKDILNLGQVCRILRIYAHDDRAWIKRFERPWTSYRNINAPIDLRRDHATLRFYLNMCIPNSNEKLHNMKFETTEQYFISTPKGNFSIQRPKGKKSFRYFWGLFYTSRIRVTLKDIQSSLKAFLNDGRSLREYWSKESPVWFLSQFKELADK